MADERTVGTMTRNAEFIFWPILVVFILLCFFLYTLSPTESYWLFITAIIGTIAGTAGWTARYRKKK